jgi:hypothetical protein
MKKVAVSIMATLVLATMSFGAQKDSSTFTGEIMDSECAKVGSHEMMMKKEGAKNATQCTLACVKMGGEYVLVNAAEKTVYQLDDQKRPEQFAGEKVTVKGTYDKDTSTIHVSDIQPPL